MDLDLEELAAVIEQLDKTEFTDFSFEKGDFRLRVSRGGHFADAAAAAPQAPAQAAHDAGPSPAAAAAPQSSPAAPAPALQAVPTRQTQATPAPSTPEAGHTVVTAPMLGTFYSSPKPGSPAFVGIGDTVEADAVVCIVEVMKLMNSVQAGVSGTVTEIYAKDGDLVEFGQPLFAVRESA
ncbi:Biotin carboxyl carrier subunit of acetyl-CoA carboxylase-like protein [Sinomonas atrocyanea]|uniref:Biotin carboxyl carrier protein of acetyl-CoA carboxylase n=1 Tax=Sinomonas atrocyanea TaxID=37927 RepID=A0A127A9Q3_9MICC|nr:biotin/lipoyl-containing protein [Sinomonas atrocyanea]AMM34422.1 Biotin carboxyl carrier subunit of acetyl-CoA carboxylase-like protein [Sinomonas atrocyanea]GEB65772.1 acetyl-CoA carboxylase biotin carboxyl carrier protein subunit [Sinomonas atrocyanea]GGG60955.1 acetyl-CoA carboxylase biotin carboxyl carrier protein subunit [Sinomonas atrocyanea]